MINKPFINITFMNKQMVSVDGYKNTKQNIEQALNIKCMFIRYDFKFYNTYIVYHYIKD